MSARKAAELFQAIRLNPEGAVPLYRQLYEELRQSILDGRLSPGVKLPSSRQLAGSLGIGRNTVLSVFEQLAGEGYVDSRGGSGTFVAHAIPRNVAAPRNVSRKVSGPSAVLAGRAELFRDVVLRHNAGEPVAFRTGTPALHEFPHALWGRLVARQLRQPPIGLLGYNDAAGYAPLRKAIAAYLRASRGVRCQWHQVLIVSGAQQGLDLAARLLVNPGDAVWMEDPGYSGTRAAMIAAGAKVISVPVDEEGLCLETAIARAPAAKAVYVTPSHQYPMGCTMSLRRRLALLEWSRNSRAWIIEDDYDGEFRYRSRPLGSLQGLASSENVI